MDEIIKKVSGILDKEDDVIALFLFGSRARGEGRKESDYDFYVVLDRNAKDSLREDEILKKVHEATKGCKSEVHLTFQYLFIVTEDKSLILKISSEGKLIFSKTYLIAPYRQFGLQKYFICRWGMDEKGFSGSDKKAFIRNSRLLISRMLHGYKQKYTYQGEKKESRKEGLVDNRTIFGEGGIIIMPDMMFDHIKYFIEKNRGKVAVMSILNSCYIPSDSIEGIEIYNIKRELERFISTRDKTDKRLFITSITPLDSDKLSVKFECEGEDKKRNTIILRKELPQEMQKRIIKRKHEFV
ncbi:MAG: nucleotidyltransferase domain-containing protein [Candidatus Woesearchaeota archaeon]